MKFPNFIKLDNGELLFNWIEFKNWLRKAGLSLEGWPEVYADGLVTFKSKTYCDLDWVYVGLLMLRQINATECIVVLENTLIAYKWFPALTDLCYFQVPESSECTEYFLGLDKPVLWLNEENQVCADYISIRSLFFDQVKSRIFPSYPMGSIHSLPYGLWLHGGGLVVKQDCIEYLLDQIKDNQSEKSRFLHTTISVVLANLAGIRADGK